MPLVIAQPCIGTKNAACTEVCPVDCIHSTDADQYFIDSENCIDCGVCVEVCPVAAIFFEDELPEAMAGLRPDQRCVLPTSHRRPKGDRSPGLAPVRPG